MSTNRPAKNMRVVHSTFSNGSSRSCLSVTSNITTAPTKATQETGMCRIGFRKKPRITRTKTVPEVFNIFASFTPYFDSSSSTSRILSPENSSAYIHFNIMKVGTMVNIIPGANSTMKSLNDTPSLAK